MKAFIWIMVAIGLLGVVAAPGLAFKGVAAGLMVMCISFAISGWLVAWQNENKRLDDRITELRDDLHELKRELSANVLTEEVIGSIRPQIASLSARLLNCEGQQNNDGLQFEVRISQLEGRISKVENFLSRVAAKKKPPASKTEIGQRNS